MAKPNFIKLPGCEPIPILFEDRSVLVIDKPRGAGELAKISKLHFRTTLRAQGLPERPKAEWRKR